jgi:hypothetical protein
VRGQKEHDQPCTTPPYMITHVSHLAWGKLSPCPWSYISQTRADLVDNIGTGESATAYPHQTQQTTNTMSTGNSRRTAEERWPMGCACLREGQVCTRVIDIGGIKMCAKGCRIHPECARDWIKTPLRRDEYPPPLPCGCLMEDEKRQHIRRWFC